MNKAPAFQFYADDFLGGVADMTQSEVGAYILLLCQQWNRGSIPVETERQQLLAKGKISDHVLSKFPKSEDGSLKNERLENERIKQAEYRDKQREKGLKSGQARAEIAKQVFNRGSTVVQPQTQPQGNSPSPSPSPSPKEDKGATLDKVLSFKKPAMEEVKIYCESVGLPAKDAEWFWYKGESNGWTNGGKPIKNWKMTISSWKAGGYMPSQKVKSFNPTSNSSIDSGRIAPHTGGNY